MKATQRISLSVCGVYLLIFLMLVCALVYQAQKDILAESRSALVLANTLLKSKLSVTELYEILSHNRHLKVTLVENPGAISTNHTKVVSIQNPQFRLNIVDSQEMYVADPVHSSAILIRSSSTAEIDEITDTVILVASVFFLALLVTLVTMRLSIVAILKPVRNICAGMRSIEEGNYKNQFDQSDILEVNQLIQDFSSMSQCLASKHREILRLRRRLSELQEQERKHLARELHDNLGQMITSISVHCFMLKQQHQQPQYVYKTAEQIQQHCADVQGSLQHLTKQLYPMALSRTGLNEAIRALVDSWGSTHNIKAFFQERGAPVTHQQTRDTHLFRIVQEALNNVAKHAMATLVNVELHSTNKAITLKISDNGTGFKVDPDNNHGLGLISIRDRAALLNANLSFDSNLHGLTISLTAPIPPIQSLTQRKVRDENSTC